MKKLLSTAVLLLGLVLGVSAQVTTSALEGFVSDESGNALVGATVIALHEPSGTQYGVATNNEGHFNMQGMRPGAPYKVTISYIGYATIEINDLTLRLGQSETLDISLKEPAGMTIDDIVVTSSAKTYQTGAENNYSLYDINNVPTINRNIYDVARLSPQVSAVKEGGVSIAGANNRYNAFQIDGTTSGDVMGLSDTGTNGGQVVANPISLESIEEIGVAVAPFDVRQSGFTGGGINVITKSGTNTLRGSAYSFYNNENFYGKTSGNNSAPISEQYTKTYGASLGGALIKDKLFFFVNGEFNREGAPSSYYPGFAGAAVTESDVLRVSERYKELTGYDGGGYGERDVKTESTYLLARLDWNINKKHKFSMRYSLLDAERDYDENAFSSFYFNGSAYSQTNRTHSLVGEINSQFSDKLYNELRIGYTTSEDSRHSDISLPFVTVKNMGSNSNTSIMIGTNPFVIADGDKHHFTFTDNFTYYHGNHSITIGTSNEIFRIYNRFISNSTGSYVYNSMEDFLADKAASYAYNYTDIDSKGSPVWGPTMTAGQFSLYVQDRWRVTDRFTLTYGLRADLPIVFYDPTVNNDFNNSIYAQQADAYTGTVPQRRVMLSPRVGFNWYTDDSHRTLLRGGVGIFTGQSPFVWMSNTFQNNGIDMKGQTLLSNVPAFSITPTITGATPNPSINVMDKGYRYPQVLRFNLAWEQQLNNGWNFSVEGLYTKTLNNVLYQNTIARDEGHKLYMVNSTAANDNNTAVYYTTKTSDYSSVYVLSNTSEGYTYSITGSVNKYFDFGLNINGSYTFGHSYSVNDGQSSQASSNWSKTYAVNSNSPELSYSIFDIPHRIVLAASYSKRYGRFGTTVSLVSIASSGERYSLTYNESKDMNGDAAKGNTLMYIPTREELQQMQFAEFSSGGQTIDAATQRAQMEAWIAGDDYLSDNRGRFAERNSMQLPFENHVDLHIAQDYYYDKTDSRKVQLSLDIINIGNLFCRDWGTYYSPLYNWKFTPVTVSSVQRDADGNATPVYQYKGSKYSKDDILSRWHAQIGLKIIF